MAIVVSDGLKAAAVNKAGSIPVARLDIFPVSGSISTSKGLKRRIYSGYYPLADEDDLLWTDNAAGIYAYNWGSSPPLGITRAMLSDNQTWSIRFDGYLKCTRPAGAAPVSYRIGYVSTGYVVISTGTNAIDDDSGTVRGSGKSPHSINDLGEIVSVSSEVFWLPITVWYSRSGIGNRLLVSERFVLFYKDSIDDEWKVMGSDVTCPTGGRYLNRTGTPVASVDASLQTPTQNVYTLILHESGGTYHFHKSSDMATEFPVVPGNTTRYVLETQAQNDYVTITWSDSISHEDVVDVQLVAQEETPWDVPVTNLNIQAHSDGAGTLSFKTGVTKSAFDENNVSRNNFSTYDLSTDSFGIIRKNRIVKGYMGYMVDGEPEYIQRFTGLIQDIKPDHKVNATTISVTCIDARVVAVKAPVTKIEDMTVSGVPNQLSYDIAQYFPEDVSALGGHGGIRPMAYDRWNLAKIVRSLLYQAGFNSTQLWGKDVFGDFLIDDRDIYLEATPSYPYSVVSIMGARAEVSDKTELIHDDLGVGWIWFNTDYTQLVAHWSEHAEVKDMPYLYTYGFDAEPWRSAKELCKSFGLMLGVDVEGNVYMRYPDNPVLYGPAERSTMPYLSYGIGWSTVEDGRAMSGAYATAVTDGAWLLIRFNGTGIKMILPRADILSNVTLYIDDIIVDGVNVLDATTGDKGHTDWTDIVTEDGFAKLQFDGAIPAANYWWYKDGVHPQTGDNPTVFTVCDNLTYGEHRLVIQLATWVMRFEGFHVITRNIDRPEHEFDATNLTDAGYKTGVENLANDVIVTGNQRGALGDFITARAVDMASINDKNSPNYIGVRKPIYIADPRITNQARADFLAKMLLRRYRRGERQPKLGSPGLPWLHPDDPVSIRDMHQVSDGTLISTIGLYSKGDLTKAQRTGTGVQPVPFQTYWVKEISDTFTKNDEATKYISEVTTTSFPPSPAYEPVPEPIMAEDDTAISNIDISIDGSGSYNPFLSDTEGKYVNIEFDMNWHARSLSVFIVAGDANIELPGGSFLHSGDILNVLSARTGFVPAGHYVLRWDGWIEGENGGMFAPGDIPLGSNYAVRFETERYSTGAPFQCRADSGYPGVIGSASYINVEQNRDAAYGASPFTVTLTPNAAPGSPPLLYDLETNGGQGLQIDITLACPAQVIIPVKVHFANMSAVPANKPSGFFASDSWDIYLRDDNTEVLEPGSYTFYFNPGRDVTKEGRKVLPFGGGAVKGRGPHKFLQMQHEMATLGEVQAKWHIAWHFTFSYGIIFNDKAGTGEMVYPSNPSWIHYNWGGPREASFTKATRTDEFLTWSFLDVKDAV